mmetsp:Transcript_35253/g.85320  ORF Transcript_35253/g.85320 Transcript_35253/m.85320 type:complete len:883 (+) Transcript_35253:487-3135(+)
MMEMMMMMTTAMTTAAAPSSGTSSHKRHQKTKPTKRHQRQQLPSSSAAVVFLLLLTTPLLLLLLLSSAGGVVDVVESFMIPPQQGRGRRQSFRSRINSNRNGHSNGNDNFGGGGGGDGGGKNIAKHSWDNSWEDPESHQSFVAASIGNWNSTTLQFGRKDGIRNDTVASVRGGSSSSGGGGGGGSSTQKQQEIVQGSKSALKRTVMFWKETIDDTTSKISQGFSKLWPFKNKKYGSGSAASSRSSSSTQEELLKALETMPIKQVTVPNTTVLPPDVLRVAVKRAGIIGNPLRTDRVQELAKTLKMWYTRQGYVLHSVTGATLQPDTATAEINVEEPKVSKSRPVELVFCKEMVEDTETGELMTFKQYYRKFHERIRSQNPAHGGGATTKNRLMRRAERPPERHELNTTLVVKERGSTKPQRIAEALKLKPGQPFRWYEERWRRVASSGIFSKVLKTAPSRQDDGSVALQIICMEPPARHLEYGIGKSIWTNAWEGEVDFDWRNVLGGGESVGVLVRRGTRDAAPSIRFRYGDDKFGLEGGYDMEVFSDYIGITGTGDNSDTNAKADTKKHKKNEMKDLLKTDDDDATSSSSSSSSSLSSTISVGSTSEDYEEDDLLNRRGATFRLRNPISPRLITNSVASASIERTSTKTGLHESIGSATLTLGPFRRFLPMDARTSLSTTLTGGTRLRGKSEGTTTTQNDDSSDTKGSGLLSSLDLNPFEVLPYSSVTATARQILPLSLLPSRSGSLTPSSSLQPITLALEHTLSTSTSSLPRHEAKAMGNACHIRGASPDGPASSSLKGTTELRIPVVVGPRQFVGPTTFVVFGDWFFVQQDNHSKFYSKSSIGVGIRKNVQGLPLKFDLCYSSEGKIKPHYSLGLDFEA